MSSLGSSPGFFDLVGNVRTMRRLKPDPVPDEMHERLEIPEEFGVVVTIPIGYPLGKFGPVRRDGAANVTYFDVWGEKD